MFTEEIKTFKRLGVRHVCIQSSAHWVTQCRLDSAADSELCIGAGIWVNDVQRAGAGCQLGITHRRRAQVWLCVVDSRAGLTRSCCRSGSMEPAFYRGDLLFLTNPPHERYKTGDITVYKVPGAEIPIVHRVLETHDFPSSNHHAPCVFSFVLPCSLGC
jgi:hypothetical protein